MEVTANSSRNSCTASRYNVEVDFLTDYQFRILGNYAACDYHYLDPGLYEPAPQIPKITCFHLVKSSLVHEYRRGHTLTFPLRENELDPTDMVTYADIGRHMSLNTNTINWLDPLRNGGGMFPMNLYRRPTAAQLRNLEALGNFMIVNVRDQDTTQFPRLNRELLNEFCSGAYLADSYATDMRRAMVQNDAYDDLESHHTALEEIPEYVEGYLIRQREMPENGWGTWDGIFNNLEDQHLYENPCWVECWILVIPGIPSRMKGVALASGVEIKNTHHRVNMIDTAQSNEHNLDILRFFL